MIHGNPECATQLSALIQGRCTTTTRQPALPDLLTTLTEGPQNLIISNVQDKAQNFRAKTQRADPERSTSDTTMSISSGQALMADASLRAGLDPHAGARAGAPRCMLDAPAEAAPCLASTLAAHATLRSFSIFQSTCSITVLFVSAPEMRLAGSLLAGLLARNLLPHCSAAARSSGPARRAASSTARTFAWPWQSVSRHGYAGSMYVTKTQVHVQTHLLEQLRSADACCHV